MQKSERERITKDKWRKDETKLEMFGEKDLEN